MNEHRNAQYTTHKVTYNEQHNSVTFVKQSLMMTGDDVLDQNDRRGDLVWSNTAKGYIILWKDGGTSTVMTE